MRPVFFFWKTAFDLFICILAMVFNYTPIKIAHLSQPQPNMSSTREWCDSLGKTSLKSLVGNKTQPYFTVRFTIGW